jgi:hypothetical protein
MEIFWVIIGVVCASLVALTAYIILGRAETRPVKQDFSDVKETFYGGAITGTSGIPCGRVSSEAEELYSFFLSKKNTLTENDSTDLNDLKNLLSKLTCLKSDLMSPGKTIMAVKELGFSTHMDIQPVADLTGRCFNKTIPEREISIQFQKWRDYGFELIRRLCTSKSITESEVKNAEQLFITVWKDVESVATSECIGKPPGDLYKTDRHGPSANVPEQLKDLREYDGYY